MTRAPKATWTRASSDVPAKDRPVPCSVRTGAVCAECAAATYEDRPVPGVVLIGVMTTSSTSVLSLPAVPVSCAGKDRQNGR